MSDLHSFMEKLPGKISKKNMDAIAEHVEATANDTSDIKAVEIHGARVAVETVNAYGLVIQLDAHGNAVTVEFPYGAEKIA